MEFVDLMFGWVPSRGGFHSACPVTNSITISITNPVVKAISFSATKLNDYFDPELTPQVQIIHWALKSSRGQALKCLSNETLGLQMKPGLSSPPPGFEIKPLAFKSGHGLSSQAQAFESKPGALKSIAQLSNHASVLK